MKAVFYDEQGTMSGANENLHAKMEELFHLTRPWRQVLHLYQGLSHCQQMDKNIQEFLQPKFITVNIHKWTGIFVLKITAAPSKMTSEFSVKLAV